VRDTVAEMAAKAQEISLEAGTKVGAAMKDVISAAVGLAGFAIESARDLVQYMVRRGQMTQDEADKLLKEAEDAHVKRGGSSLPTRSAMKAAEMKAAAEAKAAAAAAAPRPPAYFQQPVPRQVIPPKGGAAESPRAESRPEPKAEVKAAAPEPKAAAKGPAKVAAKPEAKAPAKVAAKPSKSAAPAKKAAPTKAAAKSPAKKVATKKAPAKKAPAKKAAAKKKR
jgi:polyhydroxyalkanoate synthesis regulator phasin